MDKSRDARSVKSADNLINKIFTSQVQTHDNNSNHVRVTYTRDKNRLLNNAVVTAKLHRLKLHRTLL